MISKYKFNILFLMLISFSIPFMSMGQSNTIINISDTVGCVPLKVKFSSNTNAVSYFWELGTGTSSLSNPEALYSKPGYYDIKLVLSLKNQTKDTILIKNAIRVVDSPLPDFKIENPNVCTNETITFTNTSKNASFYAWDFGDGYSSTSENATHSYKNTGKYTIKLIAYNKFGCKTSKEVKNAVFVDVPPTAKFTTSKTLSCDSTYKFVFTPKNSNLASYFWDFGDGTTSIEKSPVHVYGKTGSFVPSLKVRNATGCEDSFSFTKPIFIDRVEAPTFEVSSTNACVFAKINFTSSANNAEKWEWDFGDGNTSQQENAEHAYQKSGTYTIKLTVTNANGCSNSLVKENLITVQGGINASFSGGAKGCMPVTASFVNTSVNAISYLWEFGDGTTSTDKHPTHEFDKPGKYSVKLRAFNSSGCEKVFTMNNAVEVFQPVNANFSAVRTEGCPPFLAEFKNFSNATNFVWDFGDGYTSTDKSPVHEYQHEGSYTVKLIAVNAGGCSDTLVNENYIELKSPVVKYNNPDTTKGCTPYTTSFTDATVGNVSWLWDFGDGTTSTLQEPTHTYLKPGNYTVSLTTVNSGGCRVTINNFQRIQLVSTHAHFSYTTTLCPPYKVNFYDSSEDAVAWFWDFGDGFTSKEYNPKHTYNRSGKYTVKLIAISKYGCSSIDTLSIYYKPFGAAPTATPTYENSPKIVFAANAKGANTFSWNFGDSSFSTLENPVHTYKYPSEDILATLTITNDSCEITYSFPVFHELESNGLELVPIKADFYTSVKGGCAPLVVQFRNTSVSAKYYAWDFGDGNTSKDQNPLHVYNTVGVYQVTLKAYGILNSVDSMKMEVNVSNIGANFDVQQFSLNDSVYFIFSNNSIGGNSYIWDFGDGTYSTEKNPIHIYPGEGNTYRVKLQVIDSFGCSANTFKIIEDRIKNPISLSTTKACAGDNIIFYNALKKFKKYEWNFGDNTVSNESNPVHQYTQSGNFQPILTVYDDLDNAYSFQTESVISISAPLAMFDIKTKTGSCDSVMVEFENKSLAAKNWNWDFGDGTTSTEKNPVHLFKQVGTFNISLTVDDGKCNNTYSMNNAVTVLGTEPAFSFEQKSVCFPIVVQYTDESIDATSWLWEFGDGTTSTEQNPLHTFHTLPKSKVKLSIINKNGCSGTLTKNNIVPVRANFTVKNNKGCGPLEVIFKDASPHANEWLWDFGDGNTSTVKNPVHTYEKEGLYTVRLWVGTTDGCSDSVTQNEIVTVIKPKVEFSASHNTVCAPALIMFKDLSKNAKAWHWDFGDGIVSEVESPSHIYNKAGKYDVKLVITNEFGCKDSLFIKEYIQVLGAEPQFKVSAINGCPPLDINLLNTSKNAVSYLWNFGDGFSSTLEHPNHVYMNSGKYTISLIAYDSAGCKSVYTYPDKIVVFDSLAPDANPIQRVNVVSNTAVLIEWEKSQAEDFKAYVLYRENEDNKFVPIAHIMNENTTSYVEEGLNTLKNTYTYKLQTVDFCDNMLELESLKPHTTINLTAQNEGKHIRLYWTPYLGCEVGTYEIYHAEPNNSPQLLTVVDGSTLTFLDKSLYCPTSHSYRILAKDLCGTVLSSYSDTSVALPYNVFDEQKVDVVRSTVVDSTGVLTEWKAPSAYTELVTGYTIYRSENNKDFQAIASVPATATSYFDRSAMIQDFHYYYKIQANNSCNVQNGEGSKGVSILLEGESDRNNDILLKWSAYDQWPQAPAYYIIERQTPEGLWEVVKKIDGNTTQFKDKN